MYYTLKIKFHRGFMSAGGEYGTPGPLLDYALRTWPGRRWRIYCGKVLIAKGEGYV